MELENALERPGVLFDAGIDWITCFARHKASRKAFRTIGDEWVVEERNAAEGESAASRFGFEGYRGKHWFFGERHDGTLCVASGSLASLAARQLMRVADNVSRLDFQVTYLLEYTDEFLAVNEFNRLQSMPKQRGRPHSYQLIFTRPEGQTCNVNKRTSDACGRIYDKGVEAGLCGPGQLWRWELECKRRAAQHHSLVCRERTNLATYSTRVVKAFYHSKGLDPGWTNEVTDLAGLPTLLPRSAGGLDWLSRSVSVTVRKLINSHGLENVVQALGMDQLVQPIPEDNHGRATSANGIMAA